MLDRDHIESAVALRRLALACAAVLLAIVAAVILVIVMFMG